MQLAPAASVLPQLVVSAKEAPLTTMLLMFSAALPVFVSVAICAVLVVPEAAVKLSVVGASDAAGAEVAAPDPFNAKVCGDPVALSTIDNVAAKLATEAGVNVIDTMQLAPADSVLPQPLLAIAKSPGLVPPSVTPVMFTLRLPVFVSVAICGSLVAPTVVEKLSGPGGESVTVGTVEAAPIPVSFTVCVT